MPLRFFADHCVPVSVVRGLRRTGIEVFVLRDFIPTDSSDTVVISQTQEHEAILLSLDGDFADIVTYPPGRFGGIVALQVRDHPEVMPQILARLTVYLADHPDQAHYRGKLFLVEAHRIRIRV